MSHGIGFTAVPWIILQIEKGCWTFWFWMVSKLRKLVTKQTQGWSPAPAGGDQGWTDKQIKDFAFAQKLSNHLGITVQALTSSGLFKTDSKGKIIYDGTMIRAIDAKSQKTRLSTFKPNTAPTIIRK